LPAAEALAIAGKLNTDLNAAVTIARRIGYEVMISGKIESYRSPIAV